MNNVKATQTGNGNLGVDKGKLRIAVTSEITSYPVADATISISYTGVPENTLEKLQTDSSGQTEEIELAAPPIEYSLNQESDRQPYSEYTLNIEAEGFEPVSISGTEILADVTAIQNVEMRPRADMQEPGEVFVIPAHTLYGEYPAKIAEDEIKPVTESGEIVLSRVVIPEFVVVHDGSPRDSTARNYYVRYRDYIKNVASSEIFANYLSRPNVRQPILTQYCDGNRVSCPNWMTQWGAKELGDQGYTPIEILRYFYGSDMYINTAEEISGIPSSWPGYTLENGSSGAKVRQLQEQLNVIAGAYPALPKIQADGVYGPATAAAVREFQSIFGLPQTGTVDYRTWYKISQIYVGVSRIAELN